MRVYSLSVVANCYAGLFDAETHLALPPLFAGPSEDRIAMDTLGVGTLIALPVTYPLTLVLPWLQLLPRQ